MMRVSKRLYLVLPAWARQSSVVSRVKAHRFWHDARYDSEYYARDVEGPAVRSSHTIAEWIVSDFAPSSVVDVGCGTGALLEAMQRRGCKVFGLERSEAALKYCKARNLDVATFDLEKDSFTAARTFDVAVSTEVAEHLPKRVADRYVDLLTKLAPTVVFTAAAPGQEGIDHVNLQPSSYWIAKFQEHGFTHDGDRSENWRQGWQASGDVADFYRDNLMLFRQR